MADDFFKELQEYETITFKRNYITTVEIQARPVLGELGNTSALREYVEQKEALLDPKYPKGVPLEKLNEFASSVFYFELTKGVKSAAHAVVHLNYAGLMLESIVGYQRFADLLKIKREVAVAASVAGQREMSSYLLTHVVASKLAAGSKNSRGRPQLLEDLAQGILPWVPKLRARRKELLEKAQELEIEDIETYAHKIHNE